MEVLAEGGSLTLFGNRESPPRYSARLDDQTLIFIGEGDPIERQSDWSSWEDAIRALDRYPWRNLRPHFVHPEVRARIWSLVVADSEGIRPIRLEQWEALCAPITDRSRFHGCLLGGAVGDALGAPVEFMTREEILRRFGAEGITSYAPAFGGLGRITDDTQMTLFTADGLIRAWVRGMIKGISSYPGVVGHAYLRWLVTQGARPACPVDMAPENIGWLFQKPELHSPRAPGNTCLSSLGAMKNFGDPARNDSKGCGGVMRMAPVGLFFWKPRCRGSYGDAFQLGVDVRPELTHLQG